MATQPVRAQASSGSKVLVLLAVIAVFAGIVGYYFLSGKPTLMRLGALVVGVVVGAVLFFFSPSGSEFMAFARDSVREVRKVVWPERKESLRMTAIVFGFVLLMAVFLWGTDKIFDFVLYDLILGWKN